MRPVGRTPAVVAALTALALLALPTPVAAYVGPGAGFAFLTSFLALFVSGALALGSLLVWPFRTVLRWVRRLGAPRPRARRLVVVGLDGQDPGLTERWMAEGKLPNFSRLARAGSYRRLATTLPAVSPVAWSSFATGTNPARHNIFDFLTPDRRTYLPVLSSARVEPARRTLRLGRYRIPLGRPVLRLLRRSRPFWSVLGEHDVWSTILRVPITFPPDRFRGAQLSAMSVPDLRGTQGEFTVFTTRPAPGGAGSKPGGAESVSARAGSEPGAAESEPGGVESEPGAAQREADDEGGRWVRVRASGGRIECALEGPANDLVEGGGPLSVPVILEVDREARTARVTLDGDGIELREGRLSPWLRLRFRAAPGVHVRGICRMLLTEAGPEVSLYVTPIHLDPERPAMPISHPQYFAPYLARKLGPFATLGLAEDTSALNRGAVDGDAFLEMAYDIDEERERMLMASLDTVRSGAVVCVFDGTDRIQHMFWRELEAAGEEEPDGSGEPSVIERLYARNDALVGRVMERMGEDDVLMVLSDHGFNAFRRGVNLNAWLHAHGFLALAPSAAGNGKDGKWLRSVDWARTRAYALGLSGLYLNLKGRESGGTVEPGDEARALLDELAARLTGLQDPERGETAVRRVYQARQAYRGPYVDNAPDLVVGYARGYRCSWDGATGVVDGPVFEENTRAWSGDHSVDPELVPGVLFCSRPVAAETPSLVDVAPTALWLFGIEAPGYMEGRVFLTDEAEAPPAGGKRR